MKTVVIGSLQRDVNTIIGILEEAAVIDRYKKNDRVIVNINTAKAPEYYTATVTKVSRTKNLVYVVFDDGEKWQYKATTSKVGLLGHSAQPNKKKKGAIKPEKLGKWLAGGDPKPTKKAGPKDKLKDLKQMGDDLKGHDELKDMMGDWKIPKPAEAPPKPSDSALYKAREEQLADIKTDVPNGVGTIAEIRKPLTLKSIKSTNKTWGHNKAPVFKDFGRAKLAQVTLPPQPALFYHGLTPAGKPVLYIAASNEAPTYARRKLWHMTQNENLISKLQSEFKFKLYEE
ncbi:hypothetical protein GR11A_00120 [Vibrio phage vB_VcorM_GR11A]|nr:hypothetical protein GR11A_00120 [Vibrio phage vB_VcorM_GR11A]